MANFYHSGGGLPAGHPAYTLRSNLDDDAFAGALSGELLHVLAPRQVGKTSLVRHLQARLLNEGWRCAVVDLSALLSVPLTSWYTELGNTLAKELTPGFVPNLASHLSLNDYLAREVFLERYGHPWVAVFFDEIESTLQMRNEQNQAFSDSFFMTLRDLYQRRDSFKGLLTIVLVGATSHAYLVKDPVISPFNVGRPLNVEDFTYSETSELTRHLNHLINFDANTVVYEWTSGHPYLTHHICAELEKCFLKDRSTIRNKADVIDVIQHALLAPDNPMLTDANIRHVIKKVHSLPEPAAFIWKRLLQAELVSRRSIDVETFTDLYLTGAVKNQQGHLVIRNRIYEAIFMPDASPAQTGGSGSRDAITSQKFPGTSPAQRLSQAHNLPTKKVYGEFRSTQSVEVFLCYAYEDGPLLEELKKHLSLLLNQGIIHLWHDRQINAGTAWEPELQQHLNSAHIILLLISPDFMQSKYCYGIEMVRAMERHKRGEAFVIPVILRSVYWQTSTFGHLQALPEGGKPVKSSYWSNIDEAFVNVVEGIRVVIQQHFEQKEMGKLETPPSLQRRKRRHEIMKHSNE